MNIVDKLGMTEEFGGALSSPKTQTQVAMEPEDPTPEDRMLLPTSIKYSEDGLWHTVWIDRVLVQKMLNGMNVLEGRAFIELSPVTVEGPECSMMYIYNYSTKSWRLE